MMVSMPHGIEFHKGLIMIKMPFTPKYGSGQTLSVGVASTAGTDLDAQAKQVCLTNLSANTIYVRITTDVSAATIADYPVLSNSQQIVSKGDGQAKIAAISLVAASSLHIMVGEGY